MQGVVVQRTVFPKKRCLKRFSLSAFQTFLFWKIEGEIEGRAPVSRPMNDILSLINKALSFASAGSSHSSKTYNQEPVVQSTGLCVE